MFKKSLGKRITALFLMIGLLPLLILALFFYVQMKYSLKETVENNLITLSSQVGIDIERTIFMAYTNIKTLANNPILKSEETGKEDKLLEMQKIQDFYKVFEDITLIDLEGDVIISTTYNYRGAWKVKNWYKQAKEGSVVVSDAHILQSPYKVVMVTTAPVLDRNGRIMAVVAGQINMEKIWEITDKIKVGKTGFVFLLNKEGDIIAFPDKAKILLKLTPDSLVKEILRKTFGIIEYGNKEKKDQICGFVTLNGYLDYKGMNWKMGIIQSSKESYRVIAIVWWTILFTACGLFLIIILMSFLLTSDIVKPVRELVIAVKKAAGGDLSHSVRVSSEDEIGKLSLAFNKMILDLKKSHDEIENYSRTLELKVKQRTKELEQANDNLKEINQELDDFTYIVSHDLKEPLRVINAFSNFIYNDCKDKLTAEEIVYLERIKSNILLMEELINDLLELSRVSRKKHPFREVDMNLLIEEVKERFAYAIDEKKVNFIVNCPLPVVFCDRAWIKEVFANFISNALKFMDKPQPKIEIGSSQTGDFYCFYVKDNGIGIEKQYFDKVFQIFQRLHSRDQYSGTGVGLAICKKIVEQHYGRVWLDSEPDKGTTFYFTLPKDKGYYDQKQEGLSKALDEENKRDG